MRASLMGLLVVISVNATAAPSLSEKRLPAIKMCADLYRTLFHGVSGRRDSVTASRKERRVAVTAKAAEEFLQVAKAILGDNHRSPLEEHRLQLRDRPEDPNTMFVTYTDYLPTFKGMNAEGSEAHKARIRKRVYYVVPKGMPVSEAIAKRTELPTAKLADGAGVYVKLELKVGKPTRDNDDAELRDLTGVVEKPGLTLLEADAERILKDPDISETEMLALITRAKQLTLTKAGRTVRVNEPGEVDDVMARLRLLHQQGWASNELVPKTSMSYVREAYRVYFANPNGGAPLEVQLTFDQDIHQTFLEDGSKERYGPSDRIIEMKIPEAFADQTDAQLNNQGLGELAKLRAAYLSLVPLPGTLRDGGKPRNLMRLRSSGTAAEDQVEDGVRAPSP